MTRLRKAKLNIVFSLLFQAVSFVCGIIIPKLLLEAFGSEAYGATASITSFLAYITLLDGGIGALARSALYKPLAENDICEVSAIIAEVKNFFLKVALVFIVYVIVLALGFKRITGTSSLEFVFTFSLVLVIAISTFGEYFIGISYSILLQADQRDYISSILKIITTIINAIMVVLLIHYGFGLILVKLVSSLVFVTRPLIMSIYTRRHYKLVATRKVETKRLTQKRTAFGQHIAWVIHNNTDIMVLTLFANLSAVSVYAVYNMIISKLANITSAFTRGMEAVFGNMLAKKEITKLQKTFEDYETLISIISVWLFSVAAVLIIPFVRIYTYKITDTQYIYPLFSLMLTIASLLYSMRDPYGSMIIAAGHFKQTKVAAYGEAILNLAVSITLVFKYGLIGVAIGTVIATFFRFIYYVYYLSKNIFYRPISKFIKRFFVNFGCFVVIYILGICIISQFDVSNYFKWAICAVITTGVAGGLTVISNCIFYRQNVVTLVQKAIKKS